MNPHFKTYEGDLEMRSLVSFVHSLNDKRRHLTSSQRAAAAVEAEELLAVEKDNAAERKRAAGEKHGRGQKVPQLVGEPIDAHDNEADSHLATQFGTNRQYIKDAAKLKRENPTGFKEV